ncbi:MAG: YkgJ family cysteine cluster protein [Nitrospirota bacterium]
MTEGKTTERYDVSLNTPAGPVTASIDVSTGFVPVTDLVAPLRRLSEQAMELEEREALAAGQPVSCKKGCAACCRMLVPVSAPEAFALRETVARLPEAGRQATLRRVAETRAGLERAGLLAHLTEIAETDRQLRDEEMESTNRRYYALRLPCPFLEQEVCSIYEDRPAACRELLVTTPPELCQDVVANPVRWLPVPVRMSTVLGLVWSHLVGGPVRFIPLPLALDWAERHAAENRAAWKAGDLLDQALDKVWRYLSREIASRQNTARGAGQEARGGKT